jgi:hypothetical protein
MTTEGLLPPTRIFIDSRVATGANGSIRKEADIRLARAGLEIGIGGKVIFFLIYVHKNGMFTKSEQQ